MDDSDQGELGLIRWIREQVPTDPRVPLGIGDDAALVESSTGSGVLVTTDLLMDGVHFDVSTTDPSLIGRKALAVNLSDAAAMAGSPRTAFVSLALPESRGSILARELTGGMLELAREFDVTLAGGDTNSWNGPLVISVTLLAEPAGSGPVRRDGARPGDQILVTGALGGSLAGRHLSFTPRVREALALHKSVELHAMIDLSDGLATDLRHLIAASRVGAVIDIERLPIHDDVSSSLSDAERVERALGDGEDFELLFTVSAEDARQLHARPPFETPIRTIGEITTTQGELLIRGTDGTCQPIKSTGWEHRLGS